MYIDDTDDNSIVALHEAICEGRRLDALDLMVRIFASNTIRPLDAQHRLFPDRVPPITEKDRAH